MPTTLPFSGIPDDEHPDDESAGENEAAVRETDELTEAPEEFEIDDEDDLGHPEDDDPDADAAVEGEAGDTLDSADEDHPARLSQPRSLEEWRWDHP
jgi:hypothetical protein